MAKKFHELGFTDNYMFVKVLSTYPELCRELLELILQKEISKLTIVAYEKTVTAGPKFKGIRMDVFTKDEEQTAYDVEMQVQSKRNLPKRSRYYHSINDVELLAAGKDYKKLPKSFVIFLCKQKPDKDCNKPIYTYRSQCQEEPDRYLEDDAWTVIVNADCPEEGLSPELRDFLQYIRTGVASGEAGSLTERLDQAVASLRLNAEMGVDYMRWQEELKESFEDGREEEKQNTLREKRRADVAEKRADVAEKRADAAEEKVRQLQAELRALKNQ